MDGYHKFDNYWLNLGQFLQINYHNSISLNRKLEKKNDHDSGSI
jgi:hypothetical protein